MMNDYLKRDYEYLYEKVSFGVDDDQYIPNWIPGQKDVNLIKKLANADSLMVSTVNSIDIVARIYLIFRTAT